MTGAYRQLYTFAGETAISCKHEPLSEDDTVANFNFTVHIQSLVASFNTATAFIAVTMAAFFKSFRKGFVVCCGLDANLSGKVAKKMTLTRKSGRHALNVFLP